MAVKLTNISQEVKAPVSVPVPETLPKPAVKASDKKQVVPPPAPQKSKADDQSVDNKMDMARAAGAPAAAKSEKNRDYFPPQPVVGRDSFDIYIEKNVRNPEPGSSVQHVVVVSFKVQTDSTTTGIKIITSPGKAWSREAIRLIKEGPAWKPAEKYGKIIEDEVMVRIVFK